MVVIPYRAELSYARPPMVTYGVMVLCLLIFVWQDSNTTAVEKSAVEFCETIHDETLDSEASDYLRTDNDECIFILTELHHQPNKEVVNTFLEKHFRDHWDASEEKIQEIIGVITRHYEHYRETAPGSLDARLMYAPDSWNPVKMLTASLAHGDWGHIIFNLIFFIAFAVVLYSNQFGFVSGRQDKTCSCT